MQDDLPQMIYQQVLQKLGSQIRPGGEVLLSVDRSKSFVRYRFIFEKQLKGKQTNIVFASLPYVKQKDRVWVLDLQNRTMDLSTQTPSMDVKSSFQCNNRLMSSTIGELVQVCEKELVEWPTVKTLFQMSSLTLMSVLGKTQVHFQCGNFGAKSITLTKKFNVLLFHSSCYVTMRLPNSRQFELQPKSFDQTDHLHKTDTIMISNKNASMCMSNDIK